MNNAIQAQALATIEVFRTNLTGCGRKAAVLALATVFSETLVNGWPDDERDDIVFWFLDVVATLLDEAPKGRPN
jgi:hypothetical protein